ncbi:hypothetical protein [Amycolatopsis sp. NPDC059021]|uniref:hypothetical protein n=1 Tax=Amycolatopsis sp. NPDC059021 TaxID=3346704 RepID=UPI00366B80CA
MGKNARRITVLGFATAMAGALAFPGQASAADKPDPTLGGDCAATLQNGKQGSGLTLDAGAPLAAPGALTVGLDSTSKAKDGKNPLLTLPVGDTVKALRVGEVPAVGDLAAKGVCPAGQGLVNTVGDTTQGLLRGVTQPPGPTPPGPQPPGPQPPSPKPPAPPVPPGPGNPGSNPGNHLDPVVVGPGGAGGPGGIGDSIAGLGAGLVLPANFSQAPVITQVVPGQVPDAHVPTVDQKPGTAQALPTAMPPAKLPMLLAVLALAVVAAALVRAWIRRKPA